MNLEVDLTFCFSEIYLKLLGTPFHSDRILMIHADDDDSAILGQIEKNFLER